MSTGSKRRLVAGTLALFVVLMLGGVVFVWTTFLSGYDDPGASTGRNSAQVEQDAQTIMEVVDELPTGLEPGEEVTNSDDSEKPSPDNATARTEDDSKYLTLIFRDDSGTPLEGITFQLNPTVSEGHSPRRSFESGPDGVVRIRLGSKVISVWFSVTDWVWHSDSLQIPLESAHTKHDVTLHKLVTVNFDIRYDDGTPFHGRVRVSSLGSIDEQARPGRSSGTVGSSRWRVSETTKGWSTDTFVITETPQAFPGFSPRDMRVRVYAERAGYSTWHAETVTKEQVFEGALIQLTIPKSSRAVGSMILHFDMGVFDEYENSWWYELRPDHWRGSMSSGQRGSVPEDGKFARHGILAGGYTISVRKDDLVWTKRFTIAGGEELHLNVVLAPGAGATVQVLDERGNPLNGAILYTDGTEYLDYPVREVDGVRAAANHEGIATLKGIPAETTTLYVEAQGYEARSLPVSLTAGRVTQLGVVSLDPAHGRITVRIINAAPDQRYVALFVHPYGRGGRPTPVPVSEGRAAVFEGLQLREYLVYARFEEGGRVVSEHVTLTTGQSEVEVELNVQSLSE